ETRIRCIFKGLVGWQSGGGNGDRSSRKGSKTRAQPALWDGHATKFLDLPPQFENRLEVDGKAPHTSKSCHFCRFRRIGLLKTPRFSRLCNFISRTACQKQHQRLSYGDRVLSEAPELGRLFSVSRSLGGTDARAGCAAIVPDY